MSSCQRTAYLPQQSAEMPPKRRKLRQHQRLRSRGRLGSPTRLPSDPTSLARALQKPAWLNKKWRLSTLAPRVCLASLTSVLTAETYGRPYFVIHPYFVFLFSAKSRLICELVSQPKLLHSTANS